MLSPEDIQDLLDWQPAEEKGPHRFRQAVATPEFCQFYASKADDFKAAGVHLFRSSANQVSFAWFSAGPNAPKA